MIEDRIQLRIAGCTDTGKHRQENEDHIGYNQELGIAVLADGMGGHQSGEIAAHMAVETVLDKLRMVARQQNTRPITSSQLLEIVSNTISHSNDMIFQAAEALEQHRGMGTTVVAVMALDSTLVAGHVGDSRLYLYRDHTLRRVTKDHSLVQDLIDKGFYTEEEAKVASVGHIVTRALGSKESVAVDTTELALEQRDLLLLSSDGLTDMVPDWQIEEMLNDRGDASLELTSQALVDRANCNGGRDNVSVILLQVDRGTQ